MNKVENRYKISLFDKIMVFITLFFIFFPWISFGLNDLDTQPWPLITNSLFLLIYCGNKLKNFIFAGYVFLILIFLVSIFYFAESSIRGFLSYLMFFSTLHVLYIVFKKFFSYLSYLIPRFNILWLMAGIAQILLGKYIINFLVLVRTSEDRGVTGFAPEPTHYAFFLMFLSWLLLIIRKNQLSKKILILIFLNIFFIIFVAQSSMVFFYCVLFTMYLMSSYLKVRQVLKFIPFIIIIPYTFLFFLLADSSSRISKVVSTAISNPLLIVESDASINARLSAPVLSIYASFQDFFIPHGFDSYRDAAIRANEDLGGFFWYGYSNDKIMSGTGSLIYELGWIGIAILLLSYFIIAGNKKIYRKALAPFLLLWVFLMGAIPMSFTLIPAIILAYYFLNSYPNHSQSRIKEIQPMS